jgi:hypothetical protein
MRVILSRERTLGALHFLYYLFIFFIHSKNIYSNKQSLSLSFCGTEIWTWDLTLSRQVLYHLSHTSSPFLLRLFGDKVLHFCPDHLRPLSSPTHIPP